MLHEITVARRAKLGENLKKVFDSALSKLDVGVDYFKTIRDSNALNAKQREFHNSTFLMGICSILEVYITDVTYEFLVSFPGHIKNSSFDLEAIAKAGSALGIVKDLAKKNIYEVTYRQFKEIVDFSLSKFNKEAVLEENIIDEISEIKSTRDIYAHSNGIVNEVYERKAGKLARERTGNKLPLTDDYLVNSVEKILVFINRFEAAGPSNFRDYNKKKAFEEMWNMTSLSQIAKFEELWEKQINSDMVRPKEFSWAWSHSEKALFDFFQRIYFGDSPKISTDLSYTLLKWPPSTREGQVILSWIDSPFYF